MADLIYGALGLISGVVLGVTAVRGARRSGRAHGFAWIAVGLLVTLLAGVGLNALKDMLGDLAYQRLHFAIFYMAFALVLWGVRAAANVGDRPGTAWSGLLAYALTVGLAGVGLIDSASFRVVSASGDVRYVQEPIFYLPLIAALSLVLAAAFADSRRPGGHRRVDTWLAAFAVLSLVGILREAGILPGLGSPELDVTTIFVPIAAATICLFLGQSASMPLPDVRIRL